MAMVSVNTIMTRAREKADMVNSNFIGDTELERYVNEAYFTWYDLVVAAFEDYYLADPTEFVIAAGGDAEFPLPADFYKLVGIDKADSPAGGRFYTLKKTLWRDRNRTTSTLSYGRQPQPSYRIFKDKIVFTPPETAAGSYKLWYIPQAVIIADSEPPAISSIETYNGFENLLIVDVVIKMLNKEESDVSALMQEKALLAAKLQEMLIDRDISNSERIEEVNEGDYFW